MILEGTVLTALFIALVFAGFDMSRAVLLRMELHDAVRFGATVGALGESSDVETIEARVRNALDDVDLSTSSIRVDCSDGPHDAERWVSVTLTYAYEMISPGLSRVIGPLEISVSSSMQRLAPGSPCNPDNAGST